MLRAGQVVERYEVEQVLGEGAMSTVFRVRHVELGTHHALKLLALTRHAEWRARLLQEGRVQARLHHPNVVRITDVLMIDGVPALVMDHVGGGTLQDLLARGRLDADVAERLFLGILDGVAHAHALGLVHRDLKPANILLQPTESGPVPLVADFGLAKPWGDAGAHGLTLAGTPMGTPQYMAPEQIRDAKHVDQRADVFALGCILYELVCGVRPFDGPDVPAIFRAIASGTHTPPEVIRPDLPARFRATIAGCLQQDPDARLPSCEAIRQVLTDRPAPTRPSAPPFARPSAPTLSPITRDAIEPATETWPPEHTAPTLPTATLPLPTLPPARPIRRASPLDAARWAALAAVPLVLLAIGAPSSATQDPPLDPSAQALATAQPDPAPADDRDTSADADRTCDGRPGERIGYAKVRTLFPPRSGGTWTSGKQRAVYATPPARRGDDPGEVVCTLPPGAKIELRQDPVRVPGEGTWIPIDGSAIRR